MNGENGRGTQVKGLVGLIDEPPNGINTRIGRDGQLGDDEDEEYPCSRNIVGSHVINLKEGDVIVLPPDSVYSVGKGIVRQPLVREPYMLKEPSTSVKIFKDRLATATRRFFGGEPIVLERYSCLVDGAKIRISSDEVGSEIQMIDLKEGREITARKGVYFGSGEDVKFELCSPLERGFSGIKQAAYGPGPILQRFSGHKGGKDFRLFLSFSGDWERRLLGEGEVSEEAFDPRHLYAWDSTMKVNLVPQGTLSEVLFCGKVRHFVRMEGPGDFFYTNSGFSEGYWGNILTPPYWAHAAASFVWNIGGLRK